MYKIIKVFKRVCFVLLIIVMFGFITSLNVKALSTPYTVICNPGEDSSTMMNINFHSDLGTKDGKVIYTEKTDTTWGQAKECIAIGEDSLVFDGVSSKDASGKDMIESAKFVDWSANLTGLTKDTNYMYKISIDGVVDTKVRYFKTAGSNEYSFAWISDFHAYTPLPGRLTSGMSMINTLAKYDPSIDFILSTGDDIAWGGSYSFWKKFYAESNVEKYMWATTIGNHDYMDRTSTKSSTEFFRVVNNNPTNGYSGEEGVSYFFIYSNTLFFVLDNETLNDTTKTKCIEWMRKVVKEHPTQYIIVCEHYQWFNGISGATNTGYTRFKDFFDEVGVDLALAGNNHIYLRTKSLYNGKASTDPTEGTVYIQAPSCDNERGQDMNATLSSNSDIIEYRFTEGIRTMGGCSVKVSEDNIIVTLLDRNSKILDQTSIKPKRNNFDMSAFDYELFKNNFTMTQCNYARNEILVSIDRQAIDYVERIQIKDSTGNIVISPELSSAKNLKFSLTNLEINKIHKYKAEIIYKDLSKETIEFNVPLYEEVNLEADLSIEDGSMILNYHADNKIITKYNILVDGSLYINSTKNTTSISTRRLTSDSIIEIQASTAENTVLDRVVLSYKNYGDSNFDGLVDNEDVKVIQGYLMELSGALVDPNMADVNNDGVVDLIDATMIKMYNDKKEVEFVIDEYEITFVIDETNSYKFKVKADSLPNEPDMDNYEGFVRWDKDIQYTYYDETYTAIFEDKARSMSLSGPTTAKVGNVLTYITAVSPYDGCQSIKWSVSDKNIALVNEFGQVTFLKSGTVTLTATSYSNDTVTKEIVITVSE